MSCVAQAKHVTPERAMQIAAAYLNGSTSLETRSAVAGSKLTLSPLMQRESILRNAVGDTAYIYIFNIEDDKGFILVSGDDRAKPVLGYSLNGSFDSDSLPPSFAEWLQMYREQIAYAINSRTMPEHPDWQLTETELRTRSVSLRNVKLSTAQWSQDEPYNLQCPMYSGRRTLTGCVATAMAIVIKYHADHHGAMPSGGSSHSYTWNRQTIAASFGDYDFENMPHTASEYQTEEQRGAISKLMYHCAVGCEAVFGISGTSALTFNSVRGLTNFFGFSANMQQLSKNAFSSDEWERLLRSELDNNYPVLYSGTGTGGHAFVCDGYEDNLYHFNWGWNGLYNGYFPLSALTPDGDNFSNSQQMTVNIRYDGIGQTHLLELTSGTGSSEPHYGLELSNGLKNITINQTFNISVYWVQTTTYANYSDKVGIALFDPSDNFKELLASSNKSYSTSAIYNFGYSNCKLNSSTSSAEEGDRVRAVYSTNNGQTWNIIYGGIGLTDYINVARPISVSGVSLNQSAATLNIGQTLQLQATVIPTDATNTAVTWSSSNTSVATVNNSNGLVTARNAGSADITVKTTDGSKTAVCAITVLSNNANLASINVSAGVLSSNFSASVTSYTVSVPYSTNTITVTCTAAHQKATVSGEVYDMPLEVGNNNVSLKVVAEDGTTKTYNINIIREENDLTLNEPSDVPQAGEFIKLRSVNGALFIETSETVSDTKVYSITGALVFHSINGDIKADVAGNTQIINGLPTKQILLVKLKLSSGKESVSKIINR